MAKGKKKKDLIFFKMCNGNYTLLFLLNEPTV
jgi:hypothetical protein